MRKDGSYREHAEGVSLGTHDFLLALNELGRPATVVEIQRKLKEIRGRRGRRANAASHGGDSRRRDRALVAAFAISSRIDKTNVFFGFQLIESEAGSRDRQPTYRIATDAELVFDRWDRAADSPLRSGRAYGTGSSWRASI